MYRNKSIFAVIVISILLFVATNGENKENSNLKDVLKNNTNTKVRNQQNENNTDENILKTEAKKMLKRCGVDTEDSDNDENNNYNFHKYEENNNNNHRTFNNNYRNRYDQRQTNNGETGTDSNSDWSTHGNQNRNKNNGENQQSNRNYRNSYNSHSNNDQNYEGTQYGLRAKGNSYNENNESGGQYENFGYHNNDGSSSKNSNNQNKYDSQSFNNNNEYGLSNSNNYDSQTYNNKNEYGSTNSNNQHQNGGQQSKNRNGYSDQNSGYGENNYGRATSLGVSENRWGSQNEYGGYRMQNEEGGSQSSNSNTRNYYRPDQGYGGNNGQNGDCDENGNKYYGQKEFDYINGRRLIFTNRKLKRNSYFNKEGNKENDDNECVSQCVFGNLQLQATGFRFEIRYGILVWAGLYNNALDEDRTPSETMVIKWLQEHVIGNDMDRIKTLREARRCFARLTTTDIEDGCDFSKELANCLDLDLE